MPKVEIYTSRSCPYCHRAKTLLDAKGIRYTEIPVDGNPEVVAEAVRRSGGRRTVPQIFIENQPVGGYDDISALDRAGELDNMLGLNSRSP